MHYFEKKQSQEISQVLSNQQHLKGEWKAVRKNGNEVQPSKTKKKGSCAEKGVLRGEFRAPHTTDSGSKLAGFQISDLPLQEKELEKEYISLKVTEGRK